MKRARELRRIYLPHASFVIAKTFILQKSRILGSAQTRSRVVCLPLCCSTSSTSDGNFRGPASHLRSKPHPQTRERWPFQLNMQDPRAPLFRQSPQAHVLLGPRETTPERVRNKGIDDDVEVAETRQPHKNESINGFHLKHIYLLRQSEIESSRGRTLKIVSRNFRIQSCVMEPSAVPQTSNIARILASLVFPQNKLIPLLVDGRRFREFGLKLPQIQMKKHRGQVPTG